MLSGHAMGGMPTAKLGGRLGFSERRNMAIEFRWAGHAVAAVPQRVTMRSLPLCGTSVKAPRVRTLKTESASCLTSMI